MAPSPDNPKTVVWSHSDRQADFFELPTDGSAMHEALAWLLARYTEVKLWMGVETEEGPELLLTCVPAQPALIEGLVVYEDELPDFAANEGPPPACVNE